MHSQEQRAPTAAIPPTNASCTSHDNPDRWRRHRLARTFTAGLAVLGVTTVGGLNVAAAGADEVAAVSVTFTPTGTQFDAPPSLEGSVVGFRVTNSDTAPHTLTLFTLKPGGTLSQTLRDIATDISAQGPPAAAATRGLVAEAVFVGGVDINPATTLGLTSRRLHSGTYYAVDPTSAIVPGGQVTLLHAFRVRSEGDEDDNGGAKARITMTRADRFALSGHLRPRGSVEVDNDGNTIHFVDLVPVAPGTTDAQLQAFFDSFGPAGPTLPDPETGPPAAGESVVSPGTSVVLGYRIAAGDYALECFIADDITGMPHAFMGMHLIIHVH